MPGLKSSTWVPKDPQLRKEWDQLMAYKAAAIAEGKAQGMAQGKAEAVIRVLHARHLVVTEDDAQHILSTADLRLLDVWLERALVVSRASELWS